MLSGVLCQTNVQEINAAIFLLMLQTIKTKNTTA